MGYFARTTTASGATSSTTDQVQFTSGATGVTSRTDTNVGNVAFHVDGDASFTGKLHINEVEADTLFETSDPRKKNNMVPLAPADGHAILDVKPYFYELKTRKGEMHAGLNAAELKEVLPHAVKTGSNGGLSVSYRMVTMHMLQHLRDQSKIIADLQKQVQEKYV